MRIAKNCNENLWAYWTNICDMHRDDICDMQVAKYLICCYLFYSNWWGSCSIDWENTAHRHGICLPGIKLLVSGHTIRTVKQHGHNRHLLTRDKQTAKTLWQIWIFTTDILACWKIYIQTSVILDFKLTNFIYVPF